MNHLANATQEKPQTSSNLHFIMYDFIINKTVSLALESSTLIVIIKFHNTITQVLCTDITCLPIPQPHTTKYLLHKYIENTDAQSFLVLNYKMYRFDGQFVHFT